MPQHAPPPTPFNFNPFTSSVIRCRNKKTNSFTTVVVHCFKTKIDLLVRHYNVSKLNRFTISVSQCFKQACLLVLWYNASEQTLYYSWTTLSSRKTPLLVLYGDVSKQISLLLLYYNASIKIPLLVLHYNVLKQNPYASSELQRIEQKYLY